MTSHEIQAELGKLSRELNERRKDIALMQRLRTAESDVMSLSKRMDDLTAKLLEAQNREDKAAKDARNSRYKDVSITGSSGAFATVVNGLPNPLRTVYTISYKRWTGQDRRTDAGWAERSIVGFQSLDPDVIQYILSTAPNALPSEIAALAPGNPHEAIDRYYAAMSRGYLTSQRS